MSVAALQSNFNNTPNAMVITHNLKICYIIFSNKKPCPEAERQLVLALPR